MNIREIVNNSLVCAAENGQTFAGWRDEAIAQDMCDCDADVERYVWASGELDGARFREIVALCGELRGQHGRDMPSPL